MQKIKFLLIFFIFFNIKIIFANEISLDDLDFSDINPVINNLNLEQKIDFKSLIKDAISGNLDLSFENITNNISSYFFNELKTNIKLIKSLIIVAILSAILTNLTNSFKNKSVGELGFYITYIVLIVILFNSFNISLQIMSSLISDIKNIIDALIPLMISLVVMSGQVTSAYLFNSIIVFSSNLVIFFIQNILKPMITIACIVEIVNYLNEKDILSKTSDLIKQIAKNSINFIIVTFLGILSIQKISAPIVDNFIYKTTKSSASAIPVVGGILNGALDTFIYWMKATRSGFFVAVIILLISVCSIPIIKILAIYFIYKLTSAIVQPISDVRLIKSIDSIANFTWMIFSIVIIVVVMFICCCMILMMF